MKSNGEEGREVHVEVGDRGEKNRGGVDGHLDISTKRAKSAPFEGVMGLRRTEGVPAIHSSISSHVEDCSGTDGRRPRHSRTRSFVLGAWGASGVGGRGLSTSMSGVNDLVEGRGLRRFRDLMLNSS